jgi:hypothetical protein
MLMMLRAERDNELCNHVVSNCNKQNIYVASATRCIAVRFRERAVGLLLFGLLEGAGYLCGIENVPYQHVVWGTCRVTRRREKRGRMHDGLLRKTPRQEQQAAYESR